MDPFVDLHPLATLGADEPVCQSFHAPVMPPSTGVGRPFLSRGFLCRGVRTWDRPYLAELADAPPEALEPFAVERRNPETWFLRTVHP